MNMAFADVMLGAVSLRLYIYLRVGFRQPLWRKGVLEPLEAFFLWIDLIFLQASLISAVFISCERFYAVYWPLKHLTVSTRAYAIVITLIWTLAFLVSAFFKPVRDLLPTKTSVYRMTILISIFLLVLCCCNIGIWRKFQQKKKCAKECYSSAKQSLPSSTPDQDLAGCVCCRCVLLASSRHYSKYDGGTYGLCSYNNFSLFLYSYLFQLLCQSNHLRIESP